MKTGKELANELNINYRDFTGFMRTIGWEKFMGTWRLNKKDVTRIKAILEGAKDGDKSN